MPDREVRAAFRDKFTPAWPPLGGGARGLQTPVQY